MYIRYFEAVVDTSLQRAFHIKYDCYCKLVLEEQRYSVWVGNGKLDRRNDGSQNKRLVTITTEENTLEDK